MSPEAADIERALELLEPLRGAPDDCLDRLRRESALLRVPPGTHLFDIENLKEANGSVAASPSATAYYLLNVRHNDQPAA